MPRDGRISRRALIGGAAAAAGAAALPEAASGAAAPAKAKGTLSADVVVVGAGLSGLTAAREIVAAGRSTIVLEARDRVGGRTLNHAIGKGNVVEVGGQWIGPTQDHIAKLARRLGVNTFDTYNKGKYLFYENGKVTPYRPGGPLGAVPPDVTADIQLAPALAQVDALARTVPLDKPWTAARAVEWDSQTAETFKRSFNLGRNASNIFDLGIESVWACEPRDVSLLHDRGLAGQITSDTGPIKVTWDNSPSDGTPGVLMGFVEGHNARVFQQLSARRRRAEAIGSFVRYFGKQAANPRQYIEMNWAAEPWTRGCYVGFTPPGVLLDYGPAIKAPVGRIHWAGAETSDFWNGYMDGAVRSGERAASEALRDL
jgi:monoamine oxidase